MAIDVSEAGENRPSEPPIDPETKASIDEKIDRFNEDSFPASDPPNWSSLRHFAKTLKKKMLRQKETAGRDTLSVSDGRRW